MTVRTFTIVATMLALLSPVRPQNNIVALPVDLPSELRTQPTPRPPSIPQPAPVNLPQPVPSLPPVPAESVPQPAPLLLSPAPTTTTTTTTTTAPPPPAFSPVVVAPEAEKQPVTRNENDASSVPRASSSCTFSSKDEYNYAPKNESFTYPRAIITQALKGSVAELALNALQNAKKREASLINNSNVLSSNNNNNNNNALPGAANFPTNIGGATNFPTNIGGATNFPNNIGGATNFPTNIGTGSSLNLLPPASTNSLLGSFSNANNLNDVRNNLGNPLPNNFAFANSLSPPAGNSILNNNNNNNNNNDNGGQINGLLGALNQAVNSNPTSFNPGPPTNRNNQFNQNFDTLFSAGSNSRFPESNFFGPERFGNVPPNPGVSSPFNFYGLNGLSSGNPLGGNGNDVSYDVNAGQQTKQTPFDGLNPFNLDNKFPIGRTIRKKRQATLGGKIEGACESEPMLLREYTNHGDRCYVVNPELQQHMFVTCSNEACSKCNYPEGSSRCLPDTRGVAVWAYCENGPTAQTIDLDFIHIPIACSCKVITCS